MGGFFQFLLSTPAFSGCRKVASTFNPFRVIVRQPFAVGFLALLTLALPSIAALAALPRTVGLSQQIRSAQLMPVVAVSFASIDTRPEITATQVFTVRDGLDMGRVHAYRSPAQMISLQRFWYDFDKQLVNKIGNNEAMAVVVHAAIPLVIEPALPVPARGSVVKVVWAHLDSRKDFSKNLSIDG